MLPKPHAEAEPGPRRADRHHTEYPRLFQLVRSLRKPAELPYGKKPGRKPASP